MTAKYQLRQAAISEFTINQKKPSIAVEKDIGISDHHQNYVVPITHQSLEHHKYDNQFLSVAFNDANRIVPHSEVQSGRSNPHRAYQASLGNGSERFTFGPQNFKSTNKKVQEQKPATNMEQKPERSHRKSGKIQEIQEKKISWEQILDVHEGKASQRKGSSKSISIFSPKINEKTLKILNKELGYSEASIQKARQQTLNSELDRFIKKKGNQYLQQNYERNRRRKTEDPSAMHPNFEPIKKQSKGMRNQRSAKNNRDNNYLPGAFPPIKRANSERKEFKVKMDESERGNDLGKYRNKNNSKRSKLAKIESLNEEEEMRGRIVYDKVQKYFKLNEEKANYFLQVKSGHQVDEAWIQYLKTKMDRADLILASNM